MTNLKQLIKDNTPLIVPSIYDGISALLVRDLGFQAAYIGSYATGAAKYGLPDIGHIGLEDMADQVRRLAPVVGVPIIVDGEGGWGNALHVGRAVAVLERAGAAAVHFEDHVFGKHISPTPKLLSVDQAASHIAAAAQARTSPDFMIVARTDSVYSEGAGAAVDRLLAYQDAGADGLFAAGLLDDESQERLRAAARVPLFTVDFPGISAADQAAAGADVVFYYAVTHFAATAGMRTALETLSRTGSTTSIAGGLGTTPEFDHFLGIDQARTTATRYGLLQ